MISILTPARSGLKFLPETIATVAAQTYTDWEWIIGVNGFPHDSPTWLIARRLARGYAVTLDLHDCTNTAQARNKLAQRAKGEYVAILDVDDLWLPDKLALQISAMAINEVDVLGTRGSYFGDNTGPIDADSGPITFDMLLNKNHILNSSVLMRRELAVWEDTDYLDDYPLWLKLAHAGKRIVNMPEYLTRIRNHQDQWFPTRDNSDEIRREWQAAR